jgi:hypothetical protein
MLRFAAQLLVTDHRQYRAQPLIIGNRSLVDLLDFVKGPTLVAGKGAALHR